MCGIFAFIGEGVSEQVLKNYCERIRHRGPDNSKYITNNKVFFGFHRLAINGLDRASDQPFEIDDTILICNGEIYNYKELGIKYGFEYSTHSDCEVIIHLYRKLGIEKTCQLLDGVFAFILQDKKTGEVYAARDHLGVRPLYMGHRTQSTDIAKLPGSPHEGIAFASEAKALTFCDHYAQFPPRCYWRLSVPNIFNQYYQLEFETMSAPVDDEEEICSRIRELFTEAVRKRFAMADVEVGCLLSGGLDSSLVTALCVRFCKKPSDLKTFSIGMLGSPDLKAAQLVADFLGTDHHSIELTEQEFLDAIEDTVYTLGSFDITTVRASVGHRLISHYVRDCTNVKVLFSGEVADESSGSYAYFYMAPSSDEFQKESIRLLEDVHLFDNLRSDRSISSAGIESRVPFSDKDFLAYYMSIPGELKRPTEDRIEKYLLRKAFEGYLPEEIRLRAKCGFSDSVSDIKRSWSVIVREAIELKVTDEEFMIGRLRYSEKIRPDLKEGYYYLQIFEKFYGSYEKYADTYHALIPYQWLPKWCGNVIDPSARILSCHKED